MMRTQGFTLIELILVIMIMGVLMAVGMPRFFKKADFDERFLIDDLVSALRYAHKYAIATGCQVRATGSTVNGFSLYKDTNCISAPGTVAFPATSNVRHPSGDATFSHANSDGFAISAFDVQFTSSGSFNVATPFNSACSAQQSITVGTGAGQRTINIECGTGFVH